jgi:hypothetical protein
MPAKLYYLSAYCHSALGCLKSGLVKEALNTMDMGTKLVITKKGKK